MVTNRDEQKREETKVIDLLIMSSLGFIIGAFAVILTVLFIIDMKDNWKK